MNVIHIGLQYRIVVVYNVYQDIYILRVAFGPRGSDVPPPPKIYPPRAHTHTHTVRTSRGEGSCSFAIYPAHPLSL